MLNRKLLNFKLNRAVGNTISMQNSCIYYSEVGSRFSLVCRSHKSVTRYL